MRVEVEGALKEKIANDATVKGKRELVLKESICSVSKGMKIDRAEASSIFQLGCTTMRREMWSSLQSF